MERTIRGLSAASSDHRQRSGFAGPRRSSRWDSLNPASRVANRSLRANEFDDLARSIHRDLNPRGPLETLITRQAIRSAWRLQTHLDAEADSETDRAARSLEVAITTLDLLQGRRAEPTDLSESAEPAEIEPNEWPIVPSELDDADLAADLQGLDTKDEVPIWRGRLVYDFDVSDHSPVVRGTWITVSHVVSLIVDGATWADILRTHPELSEQDIRLCVAYAVAEDISAL